MAISGVLSAVFTFTGLWLSYAANLTTGAAIILVAGACFFVVIGFEKLRQSRKANRATISFENPK